MAARCVVVGTWPFSEQPVIKGMETLQQGKTAKDAVEQAINLAETDASYGPYHVGCGGWQNKDGRLEQDAAIMDGRGLDYGAVTALYGVKPAISVARKVMEESRHSFLTGQGATSFAMAQGFEFEDGLGTPSKKKRKTSTDGKSGIAEGHDTVGVLALRLDDNDICAGVSSSGAADKEPGRVGDSALPGAGLYADSAAGAACCTGDGENILKHCPSYRVVQLMKQGIHPKRACEQIAKEIMGRVGQQNEFEFGIVAVDKQGNHGASNIGISQWTNPVSGESYPGFPYVAFTDLMDRPRIVIVPSTSLAE